MKFQRCAFKTSRPEIVLLASSWFVNLQSAQKAAVQAARAAGKQSPTGTRPNASFRLRPRHQARIGCALPELIEKTLRAAFPQISLLGEEGGSGDVNTEYRWVVDPIDGTVNYAFGMPHAAVSIALQAKSDKWQVTGDKKDNQSHPRIPVTCHLSHVTVLGVIYGPFTDELWTATRGGPTRFNGRIVRVSRRARVEDAITAMGFSKSKLNLEKSLPHVNRLSRRAMKVRIMGSAALEWPMWPPGSWTPTSSAPSIWGHRGRCVDGGMCRRRIFHAARAGREIPHDGRQRPAAPETPDGQFAEIILNNKGAKTQRFWN